MAFSGVSGVSLGNVSSYGSSRASVSSNMVSMNSLTGVSSYSSTNTATTDQPEIDYTIPGAEILSLSSTSEVDEKKDKFDFSSFYSQKTITDVYGWAATSVLLEEFAKGAFGKTGGTIYSIVSLGVLKASLNELGDGNTDINLLSLAATAASGSSKKISSLVIKPMVNWTENQIKSLINLAMKKIGYNVTSGAVEIFEQQAGEVLKVKDLVGNTVSSATFSASVKVVTSGLFAGTAVEFLASVSANTIKSLIDSRNPEKLGDLTVVEYVAQQSKLGETFLVSACKMTCIAACTLLFPGHPQIAKAVGAGVGTAVGKSLVQTFDGDQKWCGVAGAAIVTGGAVAGMAATTMVAALTTAIALPAVGVAVIIGAAVGYLIVKGIYEISQASSPVTVIENTGAAVVAGVYA